jgi:hypothetical protein
MSAAISDDRCPECSGTLVACQHGDTVDRAFRALHHVADLRCGAEQRKLSGLPVDVQEGHEIGECYDLAGKREGVGGSSVRRLDAILKADVALAEKVRAKRVSINEAWMSIRIAGDMDDPDTWLTPPGIIESIRAAAGGQIDLDPATIATNPARSREFYSAQEGEDGLLLPWHVDRAGVAIQTVFVNPPYCGGVLTNWVRRAVGEATAHPLAIWMLIPASTDTGYGQEALAASTDVLFLRGRVQHLRADGRPKGSPEFASMIVAFGRASCASMAALGVISRRLAEVAA